VSRSFLLAYFTSETARDPLTGLDDYAGDFRTLGDQERNSALRAGLYLPSVAVAIYRGKP
jgi:hypothetical protein